MSPTNTPRVVLAHDGKSSEATSQEIREIDASVGENRKHVIHKLNDVLANFAFKGLKDYITEIQGDGIHIQLMLDPKWYDIENTMQNYFKQLIDSGIAQHVTYITVHATNGFDTLKKIREQRDASGIKTKILAVTALTSFNSNDTQRLYGSTPLHTVLKLAQEALEAGIDGVVASPEEAEPLRAIYGEKYGDFIIVTPGIQFEGDAPNDQKRISTPADAIERGATDEVIGRSILKNPQGLTKEQALNRFFDETSGVERSIDTKKYEFEKLLYTGEWLDLLKYIGAIYQRTETGKYCRLASKLLSNLFVNIGATERSYLVFKRASYELSQKLLALKTSQMYQEGKNKGKSIPLISDKVEERQDIIIMGAQMGSIRLSDRLGEMLGVESIYTEKTTPHKKTIELMQGILKQVFGGRMIDISDEEKAKNFDVLADIVGNVRDTDEQMELLRHDIDLTGKRVILSEDIVTKGTTLAKMIEIVEKKGGTVIAIACVGNRSGQDFYQYNGKKIPLVSCFVPPESETYYDEKTPVEARKDYPKLPVGADISEKPKNEWNKLIMSMRS